MSAYARIHALGAALLLVAGPLAMGQEIVPAPDPKTMAGPPSAAAGAPRVQQVPNRYVVRFIPGTPAFQRAAEVSAIGARIVHNFAFSSSIVIELPNANALQGLTRRQTVLEITPDIYAESPPSRRARRTARTTS